MHDNKLYIFASDGCRSGFLASPSEALEPMLDQKFVAWSLDTEVEYQERMVESGNYELVGPGARYRTDYNWDGAVSSKEVADGEAWADGARTGRGQLELAQLRGLERRSQAHLLILLQGRDHEDTLLCAEPADTPGVGILHIASHGFAHRIGTKREAGRPLWHEYGGMGSGMRFGLVRNEFQRWEVLDGLRVPIAWDRSFRGEFVKSVDRGAESWRMSLRRSN